MKVKINNVEYEIKTPARAWPLLALIDDLRLNAPKTLEEAEKRGEQLEKALEKLISICVSPTPPPNLWMQFLSFITMQIAKELRETTELFDKFHVKCGE